MSKWHDKEEKELLRQMHEHVAELGREVARMVFYCRLKTACGAVQVMQIQGDPPWTLELSLDEKISYKALDVNVWEPPRRGRIFERVGTEGKYTVLYEEKLS